MNSPMGESIRKPMHKFQETPSVFSPYDLAVYPYHAVLINLSQEYNYILSHICHFSEPPNIRVVLEPPTHKCINSSFLFIAE